METVEIGKITVEINEKVADNHNFYQAIITHQPYHPPQTAIGSPHFDPSSLEGRRTALVAFHRSLGAVIHNQLFPDHAIQGEFDDGALVNLKYPDGMDAPHIG